MNRHNLSRLARPAALFFLIAAILLLGLTGAAWATPTQAPSNDHSTVPKPADLKLTKRGPDDASPGDTLTYTITVKNQGPGTAQGVVVTDKLSPHVDFVSASSSCQQSANHFVTCNLGTLTNGASVTLTLRVRIRTGIHARQIQNWARVTASTPDKNFGNNKDEVRTHVEKN